MDSAFKKLIYWSGHTHSLLGLAVHQLNYSNISVKKTLLMEKVLACVTPCYRENSLERGEFHSTCISERE